MFSFEMLCKQLVSRVSSGDQTLENNKTLALRARVSYRFLVLDPLMKHSNSLFTYNIKHSQAERYQTYHRSGKGHVPDN